MISVGDRRQPNPANDANRDEQATLRWVSAALATAIGLVLFLGYHGISSDLTQYLLPVFKHSDPNFALNDWFVHETHSFHSSFEVYCRLWHWLGALRLGLGVWHVATLAGFCLSIALLGGLLGDGQPRARSLLACLPLLGGVTTGWGGYNPLVSIALPSAAFVPLALLAIYFTLRGSVPAICVCLLVTCYVHLAGGVLLCLSLGPLVAFLLLRRREDRTWRRLVPFLLVGAAVLPLLIPMLRMQQSGSDPQAYDILFYARAPHHFAFRQMSLFVHVNSLAAIIAGLLLVIGLPQRSCRQGLLIYYGTCSLLFASGYFFLEVVYWPTWVKLFPCRLFPVMLVLNAALATHLALSQDMPLRVRLRAVLLILVPFVYYKHQVAGLSLLITTFLTLVPSWSALVATTRVSMPHLGHAAYAALACHLLVWQCGDHPGFRWRNGPTELHLGLRQNTPPGSVILIPPLLEGTRLHANRAVVVNFKCAPVFASQLQEWSDRMSAITGLDATRARHVSSMLTPKAYALGFLTRSREDLLRAATRFGADYVLCPGRSRFARDAAAARVEPVWSGMDHCLFSTGNSK